MDNCINMTWITETIIVADWITLNWVKENNLTTDLNESSSEQRKGCNVFWPKQTIMSQRRLNIALFAI